MGIKTLCISDIHVDINRAYPVMETLADYAVRRQAECILIAGDICENVYKVMEEVQTLKRLSGVQVYYVPGNHDLWHTKESTLTTDEIYKLYCQDENCLCGKQIIVGEHIVLGDVGWYDYSFGSKEFTLEQYNKMEYEGRVWQDKYYNDWAEDNIGRNKWFLERMEERLVKATEYICQKGKEAYCGQNDGNEGENHGGNDGEQVAARKIAVMTHMLPHRAFTVPVEDKPMWRYFNAFLGGESWGRLYERYPVDYALCGHVHYRHEFIENGIRYMCRCLNYATEWLGDKKVSAQLESAVGFIEL